MVLILGSIISFNYDDFYKYVYRAPNIADYPKVAVDKEAIYITANDYDFETENFLGSSVAAFDKMALYEGNNGSYIVQPVYQQLFGLEFPTPELFFFPCQPRKSLNKKGVEQVLFVRTQVGDFISGGQYTSTMVTVYQIEDVLTNPKPVFTTVHVPEYRVRISGNTVPQPAPIIEPLDVPVVPIDCGMWIFRSGVVVGNSIWATMNVYSDNGLDRTVARWYEIDVSDFLNDNIAELVQAGNADPGSLTNQIGPSINADKDGNMAINFTLVGEKNYPAIAYTGRLKTDPKGTVRLPLETPKGGDTYYQRGNVNRYGDYSGLALDPCDHKTFWLFNQYPVVVNPGYADGTAFPATYGSNWSTYMPVFQINKSCLPVNAPQANNLLTAHTTNKKYEKLDATVNSLGTYTTLSSNPFMKKV